MHRVYDQFSRPILGDWFRRVNQACFASFVRGQDFRCDVRCVGVRELVPRKEVQVVGVFFVRTKGVSRRQAVNQHFARRLFSEEDDRFHQSVFRRVSVVKDHLLHGFQRVGRDYVHGVRLVPVVFCRMDNTFFQFYGSAKGEGRLGDVFFHISYFHFLRLLTITITGSRCGGW